MCTLANFQRRIAEYPPENVPQLYKDCPDKEKIFGGITPYYRYASMCKEGKNVAINEAGTLVTLEHVGFAAYDGYQEYC